jgi:chromosome segregation ATPase
MPSKAASMARMAEARPDPPRSLHDREVLTAETTVSVDVTELLARLAKRTEELAEAKVNRKHAKAQLDERTREVNAERKAHNETRQRLEDECRALEVECELLSVEGRELVAAVVQERDARTAIEADLKRAQERNAALERNLKIARGQLQQRETEATEQLPRRRRLGS